MVESIAKSSANYGDVKAQERHDPHLVREKAMERLIADSADMIDCEQNAPERLPKGEHLIEPEQVAGIVKSLTKAQRDFVCSELWGADDPANPFEAPALACDITYARTVQKAMTYNGLADRKTDGDRTAWFRLTPLGAAVRDALISALETKP